MAETKAQYAENAGQILNNILINNQASVRIIKPEESPENHVVDHTTEEWNKPEHLEKIASYLADCESRDMLRELRECHYVPPFVFKQACRQLEAGKREQIKQWVLELNEIT